MPRPERIARAQGGSPILAGNRGRTAPTCAHLLPCRDVRAGIDEGSDDIHSPLETGNVQRTEARLCILHLGVSAGCNQSQRALRVTAQDAEVQGSPSSHIRGVKLRASGHESVHDCILPSVCGEGQRRLPAVVAALSVKSHSFSVRVAHAHSRFSNCTHPRPVLGLRPRGDEPQCRGLVMPGYGSEECREPQLRVRVCVGEHFSGNR